MPHSNDAAALIEAILPAVLQAGEIARRYFRTNLAVANKPGQDSFDPVTRADTEIETFLRDALARTTPGLRIVGEEFGTTGDSADYWIIDPIDGTRAFMSGMPTWGILLGLVMNGKAAGGIMHQPFTGETFVADPKNGSRLLHLGQSTPLTGSPRTQLSHAILYSTDARMLARGGIAADFDRLASSCRLRRWGGDCYAFALVALGTIDLMVEGALAPYDIVPLIPIIESAGGRITNLAGKSPLEGGNVLAAGNAELYEQAMEILGQEK